MKEKSNWGFAILVLLALSSLSACADKINDASADTYESTSVTSAELSSSETTKSTTESSERRLRVTVSADKSTKDERMILEMFNEYYEKDFGVVKFSAETKTYGIIPYKYEVADGAIMASQNPELYQSYRGMVDSMQELSVTLMQKLGSGYTIEITNPRQLERRLVGIKDGVIIYDISREEN